ncbi:MAG: hypothetical protein GOP50_08220 [Candidatus Heimdallarchaeota archaeon]|nr:hypothetical protein [Candidatus Heimdallarchaeota archaeon]
MTIPTATPSELPINCIADENSNCAECDLEGELICFVNKNFANKFTIGNIIYRILAITIFIFSGLLIGHWWMLISYSIVLLITFTILEPRLLCSHCPFYEKKGKCLKCWALRGMPKMWKYRPEPMSKSEKILMLIFGSFIDLFPIVGAAWGMTVFGLNYTNPDLLFAGVAIVICTFLFMIVAGYFSRVLLGNACKRCANFSCSMNKVPKELVDKFLEKNPKMKESWLAYGWQTD